MQIKFDLQVSGTVPGQSRDWTGIGPGLALGHAILIRLAGLSASPGPVPGPGLALRHANLIRQPRGALVSEPHPFARYPKTCKSEDQSWSSPGTIPGSARDWTGTGPGPRELVSVQYRL